MRWMPVLVLLIACGDQSARPDAGGRDAPVVDAAIDANPNNPMTLLETGLCLDTACTQIAPGIKPYRPRWELYSDGATKRRWIYLPPGTQIDTSDMDVWQFPVGTKLWKEFTRDGVRVETRLVMRIGPGETNQDWFYMAYVWNQAQDATTAEAFGVPDANGTMHDVPSRQNCKECHDATQPSRVLGFSALQLDVDGPSGDALDLAALVGANLLTAPPTAQQGGAYFTGAALAEPALGYFHANCGHCHNPSSKVFTDITPLNLRLTVGTLATVEGAPAYLTTVDKDGMLVDGATKIVVPGQPDQSILIKRFETTNIATRMPKLGTEIMDTTGQTTLRTWISNLP